MLQVYSTLARKKLPFHKQPGDTVTMYVCGPTVYKPSHIGHMVGPVIFDTVKRYLTYLGYQVKWIVNITDVDDKLIVRANQLNTTVPALAAKMTEDYFDCLKKLNVTGIDEFPKATDHIAGMIAMMQTLIDKGYAYAAGGDVYFDVSKDSDYGKLCNRDPEQLEAGSRIEVSEKKRNPGDFAMWKGAKPGEPLEVQYDSPWGKGRPGWHIECSVMATKLLGDTLDIHGGGLDLQFPHHENELAQSESATGKPFAEVWMHNGLLKMGTAKMAGSVGNVVNIADLLQRHSPETVRFLLLSTHYRSPIEYSEERLEEMSDAVGSFYNLFDQINRVQGILNFYAIELIRLEDSQFAYNWRSSKDVPYFSSIKDDDLIEVLLPNLRNEFFTYMDDDFNTGGAIGVLFRIKTCLNRYIDIGNFISNEPDRSTYHWNLLKGIAILRELTQILGLFWAPQKEKTLGGDSELTAGLMQLLIDLRNNLRATAKGITDKSDPTKKALFDQTDLIRKRLADLGVTLEDRPGGTTWRVG